MGSSTSSPLGCSLTTNGSSLGKVKRSPASIHRKLSSVTSGLTGLANRRSNEAEIVTVGAASPEDVDIAVSAARKAFKIWRNVPGTERGNLLRKLSDLAMKNKTTLATIDTWDNGKPYGDAVADIYEVIETLNYYGGWADKIHGQVIETTPAKFAYTLREPLGVCGQIIPWK